MSWSLIKSIRNETDLRLVLPFGLQLRVGDVVSVNRRDGGVTLEGTSKSLLGTSVSKRREQGVGKVNFTTQSGDGVKVQLRAAGEASTLFENLPSAKAGADISFASSNAWVLAVAGRELVAMSDTAKLRTAILDAYARKVWRPDWVLVNSVAMVHRMTLIASKSQNTNVALEFGADVNAGSGLEANLTADASIAAMSEDITQSISAEPTTGFFTGIRVIDRWFHDPETGSLDDTVSNDDPTSASDYEFWEDADNMEL